MLQGLVLPRHLPREQGLRLPLVADLLRKTHIRVGLVVMKRRRHGVEDVPDSSRNLI